jgi:uncharacterized membrane protein YraQ (UPF0718 family)
MIAAAILIWTLVAAAAWAVARRHGPAGLRTAGQSAMTQGRMLVIRLPLALLATAFLIQTMPMEVLAPLIGPASGLTGIVIASLVGGIMPGGPMTSFPLALVFLNGGAGTPQIVALIAGWSVFAVHRLLAYEAPIMGWQFVLLRGLSSLPVPILAGLSAEATLQILF